MRFREEALSFKVSENATEEEQVQAALAMLEEQILNEGPDNIWSWDPYTATWTWEADHCPYARGGYQAASVVPVNEELLKHCTEICIPPTNTKE